MKVRFTYTSKTGETIPAFDLMPIVTCRGDAMCKHDCYACKGRYRLAEKQNSMRENTEIWNQFPMAIEKAVIGECTLVKYFRWHSAGDIPSMEYLNMMVRVAKQCKGTKFLCFTKKYEIINEYIGQHGKLPGNLTIVLSAWGSWMPDNPYGLPVAYVRLKPKNVHKPYEIPVTANKCSGFCGEYAKTKASCWSLKCGQSVVFDQH